LIIALPPRTPTADQLINLCAYLRSLKRGEGAFEDRHLTRSLCLTETHHGGNAATFTLLPGAADSEEALDSYRYLREHYPAILDLLCMAAEKNARDVTIEVGTLQRRDHVVYSHHSMISLMPRILAAFRGFKQTT
jgi:hypothetical protein